MTTLTSEEIRDEVLSLFEEQEEKLKSYDTQIGALEDEAIRMFDQETAALKERLINDQTVAEDDIQTQFLKEVALIKGKILKDVEARIQNLVSVETHQA